MVSSDEYISNRAWLRDIVGGKNIVLRGVSALEFLQLFVGYASEKEVEVYSLDKIDCENIKFSIVASFEDIEYQKFGNVLCSTVNQVVNDMLSDFDNTDENALAEAMSKYYFSHNESFDGLSVKPQNKEQFEQMKEWAIAYYEVV